MVKNTFLKRAADEAGLAALGASDALKGQSAIVVGEKDVCAAAKVLKVFKSEFQKPGLKLGVLDKALLSAGEVEALAELPAKEVLQAQLLGVLLAPLTKLVRTLNEPGASLARVLQALADKTPAEPVVAAVAEPAAAEPAAAEAVAVDLVPDPVATEPAGESPAATSEPAA